MNSRVFSCTVISLVLSFVGLVDPDRGRSIFIFSCAVIVGAVGWVLAHRVNKGKENR